jgi:hypothetical protein
MTIQSSGAAVPIRVPSRSEPEGMYAAEQTGLFRRVPARVAAGTVGA